LLPASGGSSRAGVGALWAAFPSTVTLRPLVLPADNEQAMDDLMSPAR